MGEAFEAELIIKGIDEAAADLQKLRDQLDGTGDAGASAAADTEGFGASLDGVKGAAGAATAVIGATLLAMKAIGDEMERSAGIAARFTGDIENASARINGLATDLELMTAHNKAAQAGLNLSSEAFGDASVAAARYAQAMGIETTEAVDKLMTALGNGEEGALHEFGIEVGGLTTIQERQALAVEQLADQYGDLEADAQSLGGKVGQLETAMSNFGSETLLVIGSNEQLAESWESAWRETEKLADELGLLTEDGGGMSDAQALGAGVAAVFSTLGETIGDVSTAMRSLLQAFEFWQNGNIGMAQAMLVVASHHIDAATAVEESLARNLEAATDAVGGLGGGGGGNDETTTSQQRVAGGSAAFGNEGFDSLMGANAMDEEGLDAQATILDDMVLAQDQYLAAKIAEIELADELLEAEREAFDLQLAKSEELERQEVLLERTQKGATEAVSILGDAIQMQVKGEKKFGKALKQSLGEWLKGFAKQQALQGAVQLAMGIGKVFIPGKQAEAAGHFASGAQHIAIAAAAGGGGAAMSGGGGGGGGSSAGPSAGPSSDNGGGDGGGSVVININTPMPEAEVGETMARADRAYRSRQSSGRGL